MQTTQLTLPQSIKIETYSLFEFCQEVERKINEGYRFDFDSNEHFPTAFGSMLVTGMVLKEVDTEEASDEVLVEDQTEDVTEVQPKAKPGIRGLVPLGRKAKV